MGSSLGFSSTKPYLMIEHGHNTLFINNGFRKPVWVLVLKGSGLGAHLLKMGHLIKKNNSSFFLAFSISPSLSHLLQQHT